MNITHFTQRPELKYLFISVIARNLPNYPTSQPDRQHQQNVPNTYLRHELGHFETSGRSNPCRSISFLFSDNRSVPLTHCFSA
jgi:hypothetical protein